MNKERRHHYPGTQMAAGDIDRLVALTAAVPDSGV
jgi:hypothetical protein